MLLYVGLTIGKGDNYGVSYKSNVDFLDSWLLLFGTELNFLIFIAMAYLIHLNQ